MRRQLGDFVQIGHVAAILLSDPSARPPSDEELKTLYDRFQNLDDVGDGILEAIRKYTEAVRMLKEELGAKSASFGLQQWLACANGWDGSTSLLDIVSRVVAVAGNQTQVEADVSRANANKVVDEGK